MFEGIKNLLGRNILLIEDDESVLECLQEMLELKGYTVYTATKGLEGLKFYKNGGLQIHLVVSDINLPDIDGGSLHSMIKELNPLQKYLFVSGYVDRDYLRMANDNCRIIQKPYKIEKFLDIVKEMTA